MSQLYVVPEVELVADGVQTTFEFSFVARDTDEIKVIVTAADGETDITTQYPHRVELDNEDTLDSTGPGRVIFLDNEDPGDGPNPPPVNAVVKIFRETSRDFEGTPQQVNADTVDAFRRAIAQLFRYIADVELGDTDAQVLALETDILGKLDKNLGNIDSGILRLVEKTGGVYALERKSVDDPSVYIEMASFSPDRLKDADFDTTTRTLTFTHKDNTTSEIVIPVGGTTFNPAIYEFHLNGTNLQMRTKATPHVVFWTIDLATIIPAAMGFNAATYEFHLDGTVLQMRDVAPSHTVRWSIDLASLVTRAGPTFSTRDPRAQAAKFGSIDGGKAFISTRDDIVSISETHTSDAAVRSVEDSIPNIYVSNLAADNQPTVFGYQRSPLEWYVFVDSNINRPQSLTIEDSSDIEALTAIDNAGTAVVTFADGSTAAMIRVLYQVSDPASARIFLPGQEFETDSWDGTYTPMRERSLPELSGANGAWVWQRKSISQKTTLRVFQREGGAWQLRADFSGLFDLDVLGAARAIVPIQRDPRPLVDTTGTIDGKHFFTNRPDVASITIPGADGELGTTDDVTLTVTDSRMNLRTPAEFQTDIMMWLDDASDSPYRWFILYHRAIENVADEITITDEASGDQAYLERSGSPDPVRVTLTSGETIEMVMQEYDDEDEEWTQQANADDHRQFSLSGFTVDGHEIDTDEVAELDLPEKTLAFRTISVGNFRTVSLYYNRPAANPFESSKWERLVNFEGAAGGIADLADAIARLDEDKLNKDGSGLTPSQLTALQLALGFATKLDNNLNNLRDAQSLVSGGISRLLEGFVVRPLVLAQTPTLAGGDKTKNGVLVVNRNDQALGTTGFGRVQLNTEILDDITGIETDIDNLERTKQENSMYGTRPPHTLYARTGEGGSTGQPGGAVLSTRDDIIGLGELSGSPLVNVTNADDDDNDITRNIVASRSGSDQEFLAFAHVGSIIHMWGDSEHLNEYPVSFDLVWLNADREVVRRLPYDRETGTFLSQYQVQAVPPDTMPTIVTCRRVVYSQDLPVPVHPEAGTLFRIENVVPGSGSAPYSLRDNRIEEVSAPVPTNYFRITAEHNFNPLEWWVKLLISGNPTWFLFWDFTSSSGLSELTQRLDALTTRVGEVESSTRALNTSKLDRLFGNFPTRAMLTPENFRKFIDVFMGMTAAEKSILWGLIFNTGTGAETLSLLNRFVHENVSTLTSGDGRYGIVTNEGRTEATWEKVFLQNWENFDASDISAEVLTAVKTWIGVGSGGGVNPGHQINVFTDATTLTFSSGQLADSSFLYLQGELDPGDIKITRLIPATEIPSASDGTFSFYLGSTETSGGWGVSAKATLTRTDTGATLAVVFSGATGQVSGEAFTLEKAILLPAAGGGGARIIFGEDNPNEGTTLPYSVAFSSSSGELVLSTSADLETMGSGTRAVSGPVNANIVATRNGASTPFFFECTNVSNDNTGFAYGLSGTWNDYPDQITVTIGGSDYVFSKTSGVLGTSSRVVIDGSPLAIPRFVWYTTNPAEVPGVGQITAISQVDDPDGVVANKYQLALNFALTREAILAPRNWIYIQSEDGAHILFRNIGTEFEPNWVVVLEGVRLFTENPNNLIEYVRPGDALPQLRVDGGGGSLQWAFTNNEEVTWVRSSTHTLISPVQNLVVANNAGDLFTIGLIAFFSDSDVEVATDVNLPGTSTSVSGPIHMPSGLTATAEDGSTVEFDRHNFQTGSHVGVNNVSTAVTRFLYRRTSGSFDESKKYTWRGASTSDSGAATTVIISSPLATEASQSGEGLGQAGQLAIDTTNSSIYTGYTDEDDNNFFKWRNNTARPVISEENPNESTVGAQPIESTGTEKSYFFLGDQHEVTDLDEAEWRGNSRDYSVTPGQTLHATRRIKAVHSALQNQPFGVSITYDSNNTRAILCFCMPATITLAQLGITGAFNIQFDNTVFTYHQVSESADINYGQADDVASTVFYLTDTKSNGDSYHVDTYSHYLDLYRPDEVTKIYSPDSDSATIFSPADNQTFNQTEGAQVLLEGDDADQLFTRGSQGYEKTGGTDLVTYREGGPPVVTKYARTSNASTMDLFADHFTLPEGVGNDNFLMGPSSYMLSTFRVNNIEIMRPSGHVSNYVLNLVDSNILVAPIPRAACLIINRGSDNDRIDSSDSVEFYFTCFEAQQASAFTVNAVLITLGGTQYRLPRRSQTDTPAGVTFTNATILRQGPGNAQPAARIHFDHTSIIGQRFPGTSVPVNFELEIDSSSLMINNRRFDLVFEKTTGTEVAERIPISVDPGFENYEENTNTLTKYMGGEHRVIPVHAPPLIVNNSSGNHTERVNSFVRDYVADTIHGSSRIIFDFSSVNAQVGDKFRFTRWGSRWLTSASTSHTSGRWIEPRSHGFPHGTPVRANATVGSVSSGTTMWVRDSEINRFTLVDSFDKLNTTGDADLVNPSNISSSTTFTPQTAIVHIENVPGYHTIGMDYDGQTIIVEKTLRGFTCYHDRYFEWAGEFSFFEGDGSNFLDNMSERAAFFNHTPGWINFVLRGQISTTSTNTLDQLPDHRLKLPFNISIQGDFDNMFIDNPDTTDNNRDTMLPVGHLYYQEHGANGLILSHLGIQEHERDSVRPYGLTGGENEDGLVQGDLTRTIQARDTLVWDIKVPWRSIRRDR